MKWRSQNLQASTIEGCFQSRLRRYEPACGVTAFGTASVGLRNVRVRHGETMNLEWLIATGAYTGGAAAPKSRVQPDFTLGHIDQENGEVVNAEVHPGNVPPTAVTVGADLDDVTVSILLAPVPPEAGGASSSSTCASAVPQAQEAPRVRAVRIAS